MRVLDMTEVQPVTGMGYREVNDKWVGEGTTILVRGPPRFGVEIDVPLIREQIGELRLLLGGEVIINPRMRLRRSKNDAQLAK
jgi:hypothetical protein